jgi:Mn2+/Fe2+ NRAMP family transporter
LIWSLIPIMISLIVVQEMCSRMGVVTGKGLSDLIREKFGAKITFYLMIGMFLTNMGNVISEFAGVAAGMEVFGVSKFISVPISAVLVWAMVVKGTYKQVEKIFLVACLFYIAYVVTGFIVKPDWSEVLDQFVHPRLSLAPAEMTMVIGLVGTTIAPWMQFYLQSAVVEKNIRVENYGASRMDVIVGCFMTDAIAFFIIVSCAATMYASGIRITDAKDAAVALAPLAGRHASILFAIGLANASLFAASILPLATAYYVCEGMGWESGVDKNFKTAPQFMWLYTGIIAIGALIILIPNAPLIPIMLISQVVNGVMLPFVLIFMLLLINNKGIMGDFTNSKTFNVIAWATVVIMIVLTLVLVVTSLL